MKYVYSQDSLLSLWFYDMYDIIVIVWNVAKSFSFKSSTFYTRLGWTSESKVRLETAEGKIGLKETSK